MAAVITQTVRGVGFIHGGRVLGGPRGCPGVISATRALPARTRPSTPARGPRRWRAVSVRMGSPAARRMATDSPCDAKPDGACAETRSRGVRSRVRATPTAAPATATAATAQWRACAAESTVLPRRCPRVGPERPRVRRQRGDRHRCRSGRRGCGRALPIGDRHSHAARRGRHRRIAAARDRSWHHVRGVARRRTRDRRLLWNGPTGSRQDATVW